MYHGRSIFVVIPAYNVAAHIAQVVKDIPDFVDRMVASTFADMAVDAIHEGKQNLMTAVTGGCFALQPIPDPALGPRKVDVPTMYNTERYRPTYDCKLGLPIFLTHAS